MLVDNPVQHQHQPYFSPTSLNDFSDIFNADLFAHDLVNGTVNGSSSDANSPATASSSRASSPQSPFQSTLLTPPQAAPAPYFPEYSPSSFFNFLEDEPSKQLDPMSMTMPSSAPYDFMSQFGGFGDMGMDSTMGMDINMDVSGLHNSMSLVSEPMGIDPQLVGTPSALSDIGEEDEPELQEDNDADQSASPSSSSASAASPPVVKSTSTKLRTSKKTKDKEAEQEQEKLTLVIQPVKVGGHGKARKGTVQSGGIVKKSVVATKDKENSSIPSLTPPTYTHPSAFTPTNLYSPKSTGKTADSENGKDGDEDDDDLPQDWRPSPEVFQKMTSKEKRQLRNKISARNFRVRRKEYISTLEGDIAERDRLLDAIRSELGSTQSENYALRQEIATLKRTLLEGRGVTPGTPCADEFPLLNLPPPAPLPAQSAAASLALAQQQQLASPQPPSPALAPTNATAQLLTANTQKDASANGRFWGGISANGMRLGMGGITPVHRVVLPEVSVTDLLGQFNANAVPREEKLQENLNPMMNGVAKPPMDVKTALGFEGYADVNPFTMKTLDAYRMHLWGKMAQQHHAHQAQQQQLLQQQHNQTHLTGLASAMRPSFFAAPTSLTSLLSGKHSPAAPPYTAPSSPPPPYQSAPSSPVLGLGLGKGSVMEKLEREREREREREKERAQRDHAQREKETAVYAALASQTLLRKLGGAFWDAFSGGSGSGSGSSSSSGPVPSGSGSAGGARAWDAEKVRRVLEGKAVVRVVDIEEPPMARVSTSPPVVAKAPASTSECGARKCCTDILEESMRSLSIGKKA
ncbi:hypothetical protein FPV67DRAFT_1149759 [Lyophyllum atratum]|nr:hypothetical protein FPV67DRAFT_1149759 [Lyophyllum atratum]